MRVVAGLACAVLLLLLTVQPSSAQGWRGNIVSRRTCKCVWVWVCAYRLWGSCCSYKKICKTQCDTMYSCRNGWEENSPGSRYCIKPICSLKCRNGGTCISPNKCQCPAGLTGSDCDGVVPCNVRDPCFPGICLGSGNCNCSRGFINSGENKCLQMRNSQSPQIWKCSAVLKNVDRQTDETEFEYMTDSSDAKDDKIDSIWVNFDKLNYLAIDGFANYDLDPQLPPRPDYIVQSELGVVNASVQITHTKIERGGAGRRIERDGSYSCTEGQQCTGGSRKVCRSWNCSVMETEYNTNVETGDEITVTMRYWSGGFREPKGRPVQDFLGSSSQQSLVFKFDLHDPSHPCQNDTRNCLSTRPLDVGPQFTKKPIRITWGGWMDRTSGMFRYVWEVFRLEPNGDGELQELHPLSPLNNISSSVLYNNSSSIAFPTFTPKEPGRYSVVLQAADAANNSLYVRQVLLFDDESSLEQDADSPLRVEQAVAGASLWVNDLGSQLTLQWKGHFFNRLHESSGLLGPVLPYPRQFDDAERTNMGKAKFIVDEVGIGPGQRRKFVVDELPNARGVKSFKVQKTDQSQSRPAGNWAEKGLDTEHVFPGNPSLRDGDAVKLWVRAEDYVGNNAFASVLVRFDSSSPSKSLLRTPTPRRNVDGTKYDYSSMLDVEAEDEESGVSRFQLRFTRVDTGELIRNDTFIENSPVARSRCKDPCTCITEDECYHQQVTLELNNCWMQVALENVSRLAVQVQATPLNSAHLPGKPLTVLFDRLQDLRGLTEFSGPTDIRVVSATPNSLTLNWTNLPTCLELSEWWVAYTLDGRDEKYYVDRRESVFRLTDLTPSTTYEIRVITGYDGKMSRPASITVSTDPAPGLTAGQTAGAVVGSLLAIIVVIAVVIFLYTQGLLFALLGRKKRSENLGTMPLSKGPGVDDDLYIYGGGAGSIPLSRQVTSSSVSLLEVIKEGHFARIYKATLEKNGQSSTVVAKMLQPGRMGEEDQQLMLAKIGFMATALGSHPNVLQFLGAVLDNDTWGPVMLLEYCETDTLQGWLVANRHNMTDDTIERLFQFAYGILKGMEYISSLGIVHTRLAARNVYLTFTLEVKIASLGPNSLPGGQAKERLPVRWLPPECSQSLQDADSSTDVWSFGITLWEIFSMGEKPYSHVDAHNIVHEIKRGYRLPKPEYCDDMNYNLMQQCWDEKPLKRPSFPQLLEQYKRFLSGDPQAGEYNYGNLQR